MGGWGIMEETELEEGEAAGYDVGDDTSIDPDIALSYIDEKLQNVLGHFQKDFEGGVSAENLGAKFGGYGSFLPMYQRSPPTRSQPKTPPTAQNHSMSRSPGNFPSEGAPQNFTAPLDGPVFQSRGTPASGSMHLLNNPNCSSGDGSVRQDSFLISEKVYLQQEPSFIKSVNPPDHKRVKVRIKVGSDKAAQKNSDLYAGLGLTSSSSSMGNSPEESCGTPFSSREILSASPCSMLQNLASLPISGDLLLSPLHENLLYLLRSGKELVESKPVASIKGSRYNTFSSSSASLLGVEEVLVGKESKSFGTGENNKQSNHENQVHAVDRKNSESETLESKRSLPQDLTHKPVSYSEFDTGQFSRDDGRAYEAEQHKPVKKRDLYTEKVKDRLPVSDLVKDETLESMLVQDDDKNKHQGSSSVEKIGKLRVKRSEKDAPSDMKKDSRNKGNKLSDSLADISKGKMDSLEATGHLKHEGGLRLDHNLSGKLNATKAVSIKLSSKEKKKLKESRTSADPTPDLVGASFKSGVAAAAKDRKSSQKDVKKIRDSYKDLLDIGVEPINSRPDLSEIPSLDKSKDSNCGSNAGKRGIFIKSKKSGLKKLTGQIGLEISGRETLNDNIPASNGANPGAEPAPAPYLINEDWVCCDRCQKWRLLPLGKKPEQLPDKWTCSMLTWLPGMNHCDLSEDETTQAVRAAHHASTQNNLQNEADAQHFDHIHPNVGSHHAINQGKKFKTKETSHTSNSAGPVINSQMVKNTRQDVVKSRSLRDMNQPLPEASLIQKPYTKDPSDAKAKKKIKRDIESVQRGQGSAKKIKTEGAIDMDNLCTEYGGDVGRKRPSSGTGLPTKGAMKDKQKQIDARESEKLKVSLIKRRDSLQDTLNSGSLDIKTDEARGTSSKKRKLKDGPDGGDYLERKPSSGNRFLDTKVSVNEDSGDSGFKREMKFKVSASEGKDLSKSRGDVKSKRGGAKTRMLSSGNRTDMVDQKFMKAQQLRAKLASGLTFEDVEALKKDLGSEQLSTAATSSSSKVSGSRRSRVKYPELKGSPVESVSSSPMRMSNVNKFSQSRMSDLEKDNSNFGDFPGIGSPRSLYGDDILESNQLSTTMKERLSSASHLESSENPLLEFQENNTKVKGPSALPGHAYGHMDNIDADTSGRHSPCPSYTLATAGFSSKARMVKNRHDPVLRKNSGIVSSAYSIENAKSSGFNSERIAVKATDLASDQKILHLKKSMREETEIQQNHASCHEVVGDSNHPFSDESGLKDLRSVDKVSQRDSEKRMESGRWGDIRRQSQPKHEKCHRSDGNVSALGSVDWKNSTSHNLVEDSEVETAKKSISTKEEARKGKLQICSNVDYTDGVCSTVSKSATESQRGRPLDARVLNGSTSGEGLEVPKVSGNYVHQNENHGSMILPVSDQCVGQDPSGSSNTKKEAPIHSASAALKEAEKLRDYADRLKESGFGFECNEAHFQAALMFLLGACLLESSNTESSNHGDMNQMQIYSSAARLCETCAHEYEKRQEMAAAALAYKCMEVAYMRVVYCKNLSTNRVWHDLQSSLQMIPQSESPSSSASDIDNLNNLVATDKAALFKVNGSLAGNHIIAPRNRPSFVRLLDFTKDVNSAMDAARKSHCAFAAATNMTVDQSQNKEITNSVKRVIDFSFQDVEEFVRMVRHAIEAISRQGFGGS